MSSIALRGVFTNDALQMIWGEIELMLEKDKKAVGIAFDDASVRGSIWISYVHRSCLMGQNRHESKDLWKDLCLAMRLAGRLAQDAGIKRLVNLREGAGTTWVMYARRDTDGSLTILEQILHRADEVFELLAEPLRESE